VNLLTAIPSKFYPDLAPIIDQKRDHRFIDILIGFLEERLDVVNLSLKKSILLCIRHFFQPVSEQKEMLTPIMTLLSDMADNCKELRLYLRACILPPLRDVSQRPEEGFVSIVYLTFLCVDSYKIDKRTVSLILGVTLRNKLVKLMTSVTDISTTSAELLFQLCNRNGKSGVHFKIGKSPHFVNWCVFFY